MSRYGIHNHAFVPNEEREEWVQKPSFDYYMVVDFEATCGKSVARHQMEIIEFPMVLVDARTFPTQVVPDSEFQVYIKPVMNPKLSPFCNELTGITQAQVDQGVSFPEAFSMIQNRLIEWNLLFKSVCVVTCGDWDFKTMFPLQLLHTYATMGRKIPYPSMFKKWCNISSVVKDIIGGSGGMKNMLKTLDIPLTGRHHSGIDDCHNTAKVVVDVLNKGIDLVANGQADMAFFRKRYTRIVPPSCLPTCKFDGKRHNPRHRTKVQYLKQINPANPGT